MLNVPLIIEATLKNHRAYIINLGYLDETWNKSHQLSVSRIVIPAQDGQAVLRLELVTIGRVVHDDNVFHATAYALHILHKLVVEESAVLAEQSLRSYPLGVEYVHQRDSVL